MSPLTQDVIPECYGSGVSCSHYSVFKKMGSFLWGIESTEIPCCIVLLPLTGSACPPLLQAVEHARVTVTVGEAHIRVLVEVMVGEVHTRVLVETGILFCVLRGGAWGCL